jgi:hypothetical protein
MGWSRGGVALSVGAVAAVVLELRFPAARGKSPDVPINKNCVRR